MAKNSWSKWTDETVEKFKVMYPDSEWDVLLSTFPFSKSSMASKACELGISRRKVYSSDEDLFIQQCFDQGMPDSEIAELLPMRTATGISTRRQKLGIIAGRKWSAAENELLRNLYGTMPSDEVVKHFPKRSRNAIISHAISLGLAGYRDYHPYTDYEHEFIRKNYLSMSDVEMGEALGHPACSIKNRRNKLGCHRADSTTKYDDTALYIRRHNDSWKLESMRRCGYKCILTGERFDDIHHLTSQNTIIRATYMAENINVENFNINSLNDNERAAFLSAFYKEQSKHPFGVCLTRDIHKHFHNEYGYGNNTPEQFYEFVERFYPDRLIIVA